MEFTSIVLSELTPNCCFECYVSLFSMLFSHAKCVLWSLTCLLCLYNLLCYFVFVYFLWFWQTRTILYQVIFRLKYNYNVIIAVYHTTNYSPRGLIYILLLFYILFVSRYFCLTVVSICFYFHFVSLSFYLCVRMSIYIYLSIYQYM